MAQAIIIPGAGKVAPFRIDRRLVTQGEYSAYTLEVAGSLPPRMGGEPSAPAVFLTAEEAAGFARWRGGRLATDAEWERASLHVDGVSAFGVERFAEVWELTSTANIVRGGRWRDRPGEPAQLENRSTEVNPARDVGFRCAYPLGLPDRALDDWYRRPGVRATAERERLATLFRSEAGLGAYLAQELTRVGLAYRMRRRNMAPNLVDAFVEGRGNMLEGLAKTWGNPDDETLATRLSFEWGDSRDYELYAEHGFLVITHSTMTAGTEAPIQHTMYGETLTRLPLETFTKLTYDASDFIRYVVHHFEGRYDSPT